MGPVTEHVGRACLQRLVEMEPWNGSSTASAPFPVERNQDDGSMDALHNTGRDDPDHPRMPPLAGEHDAEVGTRVVLPLQHFEGFGQRALVLGLPVPVRRIELLGELSCLGFVIGEQKPKRIRRLPDAARGVDSRCHHETQLSRRDLHDGHACYVQQCGEAPYLRTRKAFQTMVDEHTVLTSERDEVGDGRKGNQIQVRDQRPRIGIERVGDQLTHLVGHAGAAQALVRVLAVGTLGVHNRHRVGK